MLISQKIGIDLKKLLWAVTFVAALAITTEVALRLGGLENATTVGFLFLVLVVSSAVFGGLAVAIVTSFVATLFFNYNFFPPVGTFRIASFDDWVALFAFLFTSIVISRLTASAREHSRKSHVMEKSVLGMRQFGAWLISVPRDSVTLSAIAENAARIFELEYCSIHVYAEGKWHHFSGSSIGTISGEVTENLKKKFDHQTEMMELIHEQGIGVRYSTIRPGEDSLAVVAVKSQHLPSSTIDSFASMIGVLLSEVVEDKMSLF